jgi:hypothetical protein
VRQPLTAAIACVLALAALLGLLTRAARSDEQRRVYLVGDSLVLQSADYWLERMADDGWIARQASFAGTNTCDWFDDMRKQRDEFKPNVVAMSFGGNDATACMRNPDGSQFEPAQLLRKYRTDTQEALDIFGPDVTIYLIAPPAMYDGDNRFPPIYRELAAAAPNVEFVDGGELITPRRDWRKTAPCLPAEPCTGPEVDGERHNVIRSADTVHFCPVPNTVSEPCPSYSSGAYRYALTIADAIEQRR